MSAKSRGIIERSLSSFVVALQHTFLAAFNGALLACAALGAVGILAALVRGQDRGIAR